MRSVDTRWLIPTPADVETERLQAEQEGRDISHLLDDFARLERTSSVPPTEFFHLLDEVQRVPSATADEEPNDLQSIFYRCPGARALRVDGVDMEDRIRGAWRGRVAGCMLGKPVEGWSRRAISKMLEETGQGPPLRGFLRRWDASAAYGPVAPGNEDAFVDDLDVLPEDDDLNYTVIALLVVERCGVGFSTEHVAEEWIRRLQPLKTCTAERVAFRNLLLGLKPPETATWRNPYREWIGAQIRSDLYGYIAPGDPMRAAAMAWSDARLSHTRNGIYASMFYAAMISSAFGMNEPRAVVENGLRCVPPTSRLAQALMRVLTEAAEMDSNAALDAIHVRWNESRQHDWCHSISNAEVVTWALLHGRGDFERSVCMAVEAGFDTDCNAATVGSILGAMLGSQKLEGTFASKSAHLPLRTGVRGVPHVTEREFLDRVVSLLNR
jgi:ADP-ribosylglycohydrolase